ncbi:MAG: GHKL domain-containing protein [Bdellovibrionales bacterium]|nr:GHKL domain-containing protein [Bdellovibrionales bacterium]
MKFKLLISILVAAALLSVVLWRVDRFVYGDRMAWAEAQARSQISSLTQATNVEIQSARRMLATVSNDTFKRETANWKAFQPYYALALMTSKDGALAISRMVSKADSPAANWTANELGQYIGFMGKELESRGTVLLRSFKDPQKNHHVAVIFAGGGNAYILIGSGENFQSMIESQKGSISQISIIASDGLMISHATPDYVGNVMSDSTMLKEIRTAGSAQGLGQYMQGKTQIFGMYSQIPGTNSYIISTVPIEELMKGRLSLAWQFVFMAVGLCLIGAAIYFWQEKRAASLPGAPAMAPAAPTVKPTAQRQPVAPSVPAPPPPVAATAPTPSHAPSVVTSNEVLTAPVAPRTPAGSMDPAMLSPHDVPTAAPPPKNKGGTITPQELQAEKTEAFRQVATALGQEMRSPLASILGFSQMVLSKTQDPDVVQAVESILREARSSRDVLEKLVTFTGEHSTEKNESKIEGPIMQALKNIDGKITQKGVKVEKEFKETSPWPMASAELVKAFENIFMNAIEAMERMPEKVMKIKTWEAGDGLHVTVSDTGEGIDIENVGKVFDPFFTTRSFAHHVGLGLPVVVGILKEHNGSVQMQSQRGKGTTVEMIFAPNAIAKSVSSLPKAPPPMKAPELPADLPKASASHDEVVEVMKQAEVPKEKLTDVNVDSLLELDGDAPLRFLDGQGFDDEPGPSIPLPKEATPRPTKPAVAPPVIAPPSMPPPMVVSMPSAPPPTMAPPAFVPPEDEMEHEANEATVAISMPETGEEASLEATRIESSMEMSEGMQTPAAAPNLVIDKPAAPPMMARKTELDSYKVEVRRPGKRT